MINAKPQTKRKPRTYRKVTSSTIAEFKALRALEGNATAAIRILEPTRIAPKDRAFHIAKKADTQHTADFIDQQLQQIGIDSVNRLGKLVNSSDERVATKNIHYAIDHIRGQSTKKSITLSGKVKFQSVLD